MNARSMSSKRAIQSSLLIASGMIGSPSGHGNGFVHRKITIATMTTVLTATNRRPTGRSGPSRTSHGTIRISASVPGIHAQFCIDWRKSSCGADG